MGYNIMTLGLYVYLQYAKLLQAQECRAGWWWLNLAKNGNFLIVRGNILLNLGGEGGPAALINKNQPCVLNCEDPLVPCPWRMMFHPCHCEALAIEKSQYVESDFSQPANLVTITL